ncbi:MAG: hypothetical protein JWN71_1396 [Xanthobacteraceae bacterium]|jgi:ribosomal protein L37AE/L43A|nr:hypothetical protein [Xanthobacteraceae bacterium]
MTTLHEMSDAPAGSTLLRSNPCPQCNEKLFAPAWSEHVSERCVRHYWVCDACGYDFESSVYLAVPVREAEAA